jgi:2-polyprenyl-3-methyl-5-hydroxy-6-metoxy-1,4-benzoquinol methylase
MSVDDRVRWDKKYKNNIIPTKVVEVVEKNAKLATGESALDIACGMGRNAKFLATEGFNVHALDISDVAIKSLKNIENIRAEEVDFDTYTLKENSYDLIICTYYLNRSLFPQIERALKDGGVFIFETFVHHPDNTKAPSNKSFLLESGELERTFSKNYEILHLNEFWKDGVCGDRVLRASIVIKKL